MFFRPSLFPKTPRRISQTADTVTESSHIPHNKYQTLDSCQSLRDTQRHFKSLPLNSARSPEPIYSRRLPNLWLDQNRPTSKYIKHRISNISTTVITTKNDKLSWWLRGRYMHMALCICIQICSDCCVWCGGMSYGHGNQSWEGQLSLQLCYGFYDVFSVFLDW